MLIEVIQVDIPMEARWVIDAYGGNTSSYAYRGNKSGGRPGNIQEFLGSAFASANVPQYRYQVVIPMEARRRMLCLQRHRYWWAPANSYKRCSRAGMKFWLRTVSSGVYMPIEAKERDAYGGESSNCLIQIYPTEASHPVIQRLAFKPRFCDWIISHRRPPKCNIMWALRCTTVPQV